MTRFGFSCSAALTASNPFAASAMTRAGYASMICRIPNLTGALSSARMTPITSFFYRDDG